MAVVQRILPAPPHVVYEEWLDAEGMAEWMCPRPARPTRIALDPRVGGRIRIDIDDEGLQVTVTGEYLQLDRPRLIRFSWWCSIWEPEDPQSVVTVTLEPHPAEHTLMTIRHEQLPPTVVDRHARGWTLIAGQLENTLLRRSP